MELPKARKEVQAVRAYLDASREVDAAGARAGARAGDGWAAPPVAGDGEEDADGHMERLAADALGWMFDFLNGSVTVGKRRERQGMLVQLGAYEVLRDVTLGPASALSDCALRALAQLLLLNHRVSRRAIEDGVLDFLAGLAGAEAEAEAGGGRLPFSRGNLATCLNSITAIVLDAHRKILSSGTAARVLAQMAADPSCSQVQNGQTGMIRNLCFNEDIHDDLVAMGAIDVLLRVSATAHSYHASQALMGVACLIGHEEAKGSAELRVEASPRLVQVIATALARSLDGKSIDNVLYTPWKICLALSKLSAADPNRELILNSVAAAGGAGGAAAGGADEGNVGGGGGDAGAARGGGGRSGEPMLVLLERALWLPPDAEDPYSSRQQVYTTLTIWNLAMLGARGVARIRERKGLVRLLTALATRPCTTFQVARDELTEDLREQDEVTENARGILLLLNCCSK